MNDDDQEDDEDKGSPPAAGGLPSNVNPVVLQYLNSLKSPMMNTPKPAMMGQTPMTQSAMPPAGAGPGANMPGSSTDAMRLNLLSQMSQAGTPTPPPAPVDYSPIASLARAAAQVGTLGGKASDTSSVDAAVQGYRQQGQDALQRSQLAQAEKDRATGLNMRTLEYLQSRDDRQNQFAQANQNRQDMLNSRLQDRQDARDAMQQQQSERQGIQNQTRNDKLAMQLKDDLDPNKARGGNLAANQKKVDQAERLQGLIHDATGNISNLDQRQMEELAIGLNSMLSNSNSGSTTQVAALVPSTVMGNANKLKEWLTNDPTGTNQTAFVQRMADTVDREKQIASDQVKAAQISRLSAYQHFSQSNPEAYAQVLSSYGIDPSKDIDSQGRYAKAAKPAKAQAEPDSGVAYGATTAAPRPPAPKAGDMMGGYKFIGGDPSKPESWEKQ